jgi:hypothetical protein
MKMTVVVKKEVGLGDKEKLESQGTEVKNSLEGEVTCKEFSYKA